MIVDEFIGLGVIRAEPVLGTGGFSAVLILLLVFLCHCPDGGEDDHRDHREP